MPWQLILGHIFVIGGCYITACGINLLLKTNARPVDIFKQPLFWGLFTIMAGFCFFFAPLLVKSY
jgi:hypothetical protein